MNATEASKPASIDALIAAYREAHDAFEATHADTIAEEERPEYLAAQDRCRAALHALRDARPTAPGELAKQLRWIVEQQDDLFQPPLDEILEHVADQCAALEAPGADDARLDAVEDGIFEVKAVAVLLDRYLMHRPAGMYENWAEMNRDAAQLRYLIGRLAVEVDALQSAFCGEGLAAQLSVRPRRDGEAALVVAS